jgi:hypothetical protein
MLGGGGGGVVCMAQLPPKNRATGLEEEEDS